MNYKMLITDFDDTLLRSDGTISQNNIENINNMIKKGYKFVICTGRAIKSILPIAQSLKLKGDLICCQGSLICDIESGKVLRETGLDWAKAEKQIKILEDLNIYAQIYAKGDMYYKTRTDFTDEYEEICKIKGVQVGENLSEFTRKNKLLLNKIIGICDETLVQKLIVDLSEEYPENSYSMSKPYFIEIVNKSATKGSAIEYLSTLYNIKREELIAMGDSYNDIPMLEYAGRGIAVGNAFEKVKLMADEITLSNDEDGVSKVIEKYFI